MKLSFTFTLLALGSLIVSCSNPDYDASGELISSKNGSHQTLTSVNRFKASTNTGNLVATAMKRTHNLDIVLYPSEFLRDSDFGALSPSAIDSDIEQVTKLYPYGKKDQFLLGTMKGKDIGKLIVQRAQEKYYVPFQTAGIKYHLNFSGGINTAKYFNDSDGNKINDNKLYKVAISKYFYNNRDVFPNYEYKNGLSFSYKHSDLVISARDSVRSFLKSVDYNRIDLNEKRAMIINHKKKNLGYLAINKIQGISHLSPYYAHTVTTSGVVTAKGVIDRFPGGLELYIQSEQSDLDDRTSEAIRVYIEDENASVNIGDKVSFTGVVYEEILNSGLGSTTLRDISSFKILSSSNPLPKAIHLGAGGREIPGKIFSTHNGNLNSKASLDLNEAVDFFESIEGMRVSINSPVVTGFRGGNEDASDMGKAKGHLSLYVKADGDTDFKNKTSVGGLIINEQEDDHNPEIIQIVKSHLSTGIPTDHYYKVGDLIPGLMTGVMAYASNIFGDGEFTLVLPLAQDGFTKLSSKTNELDCDGKNTTFNDGEFTPIACRGVTKLVSNQDSLTVATYNVENLSGDQDNRIKAAADSISINLKCPDVVNLVEIQDDNGIIFSGGSGAEKTLSKLIGSLNCSGRDYRAVNIDPVVHNEGGQPGGNIRVAQIYDANKLEFNYRPVKDSLSETFVLDNGSINFNPGRVYPNDSAFSGSRKSIITEYIFKGKKVFVIGNHFNSKMGDTSRWGAIQPFNSGSEQRRLSIAKKINDFVAILSKRSSGSGVIVLGDFNANIAEYSMRILEGRYLKNLVSYGELVDINDRYTTNHNGNSQALDYIFANKVLLNMQPQVEILHLNSDYMGKISDHDPLVAKFQF